MDWHFAHINNRWTKRALVSAGFGYPSPQGEAGLGNWKPIFSVAGIGGQDSAAAAAAAVEEKRVKDLESGRLQSGSRGQSSSGDDQIHSHEYGASNGAGDRRSSGDSLEYAKRLAQSGAYRTGTTGRVAVVHGINRPLFHIDLTSALQSAIANAERRDTESFGQQEEEAGPMRVPQKH